MESRHPLNQSKLYKIKTRRKLAEFFGLEEKILQSVAAMPRPYSHREIEIIRNGKTKTRVIQEPRGELRKVHIRVRSALSRIEPPGFLFCPVKGRSYVENAKMHLGAKVIRTIDISKYFPSTPSHRVYWFFHSIMECSSDVAAMLAKLLTVEGHLATGSTVSPILSFYAFYDMWNQISLLARSKGCIITVYVDDITISGQSVADSLIWSIKQEIHKRGLEYHKERHFRNGVGEVTGVIVRDGEILLPNRQHKKLYEVKSALLDPRNIDVAPQLTNRLTGLVSQQKQILMFKEKQGNRQ